jgi:thiol-disulfide isomerase/thioredoxin
MHVRRLPSGSVAASWAAGLICLSLLGCSQQEELKLDPGVSPFYPGDSKTAKAPAQPEADRDRSSGRGSASPTTDGAASSSLAGSKPLDPLVRPEDIERQLRLALRTADKGDKARAARVLDQILAIEPLNREALAARASLALEESQQAASPPERTAALGKAVGLARTLHRAYEQAKPKERGLYGRALYEEAQMLVRQGRNDQALTVLRESYDGGFDPFDRLEADDAMASLRASPQYRAMLKSIDDTDLAKAHDRVKDRLNRPLDMAFSFTLPDLDGKSVSLADFKGKVVLIDIWGTWCKPCREAIPLLVELNRKYRRRGLEIVGIDYEKDAPDPETARQVVKQFVQGAGIPYRCVMGDVPTLQKIPDMKGFPTSMVIDRSGKVRLLITDNSNGTPEVLNAVIQVLLAEPATPPSGGAGAAAAKPR